MRCTFIATHYPPCTGFGGVCESSFGLSRALARAGIDVAVVTSDATKGSRLSPEEFIAVEEDSLRIHPFRYLFSERSCFSLTARRVIEDLMADSDIVHVNGIYTHPVTVAARSARRAGKPHIVACRNGLDPWMLRIKRTKKLFGFRLYVKGDLDGATCIHVTAKHEMDACLAMGIRGPFTIIPNGIHPPEFSALSEADLAEESWPILKDRKVVLFLSRLSPQKGLDILIPAWQTIMRKHPDALLVVAGPDHLSYGRFVRELAAASPYSGDIFFTGNVVGEAKLALYRRADVFALPSYSENFGNVVAEALMCETPVVTTHATPWDELEKYSCGRYVPVDREAIVDAIDSILRLPAEERALMGRRGRDFILSSYTWDAAARKMITVYKAILGGEEIPLRPEACAQGSHSSWSGSHLA